MSELLSCPFCGKRPHLIEPDKGDFKWSVSCLHCVAIDMQDISKEGVVEKWNTRHYPPRIQREINLQTPRKPVDGCCPECGHLWKARPITCFCGQALDWSK